MYQTMLNTLGINMSEDENNIEWVQKAVFYVMFGEVYGFHQEYIA